MTKAPHNRDPEDESTTLFECTEEYVRQTPEQRATYALGFQQGFLQGMRKAILYTEDATPDGYREWETRVIAWQGSQSLEPPQPPAFEPQAEDYDEDQEAQ